MAFQHATARRVRIKRMRIFTIVLVDVLELLNRCFKSLKGSNAICILAIRFPDGRLHRRLSASVQVDRLQGVRERVFRI